MAEPHSRFLELAVQTGDVPPRAAVTIAGKVKAMGLTHQRIGESIRDETLWMIVEVTGPVFQVGRYEVRVRRPEAAALFKEVAVGDTVGVSGHRSMPRDFGGDDVIQATHVEIVAIGQPSLERLKAAAVSEAECAAAAVEAMARAIERFAEAGGDPHDVQRAVAQAVGSGTGISDFLSLEAEVIAGHLVEDAAG